MVTVAPEAIQAREDSRRACLRIRGRRGCMPEEYAQRGDPARVYGVAACDLAPGSAAATADERMSHECFLIPNMQLYVARALVRVFVR